MTLFETYLLWLTASGLVLGIWGIAWARSSGVAWRATSGRWLFVLALLLLGSASLVAASHRSDGLVPLGLTCTFLVVGMLWETPRTGWKTTSTIPEKSW